MKPQPASNPAFLHRQAVGEFRNGRMGEGIKLLQKALELNPGSGEMHSHLAIALYQTGDARLAETHFDKAARLSPKSPEVQTDCGVFLLETNRPQEAEKLFRRALELNPNSAEAMLNLGRSLMRQGRHDEAEGPYVAALKLRPNWVDALFNLGMLCLKAEKPEQQGKGRQLLEKAVALNPKHEQAWAGLIQSYERPGNFAAAEQTLDRALKHLPDSVELAMSRVTALIRQGKKDEIAPILARVSQKLKGLKELSAVNPAVLHDLGKGYDEAGDPASAMHWFRASSAAQKKTYGERGLSADAFPQRVEGYRRALRDAGKWRAALPLPADMPCPVFLVGFPRSGTTLLEQVFAGHPSISVAEERPGVRAAEIKIKELAKKPEWEALAGLDDSTIAAARNAYYTAMRDHGCVLDPAGVFIDKLPLNLVHVPLIMRLFPQARFILALRHPCDCVLSNYMQRFNPNEAMQQMIDLDQAAKFYAQCFSAWEDAVAALKPAFHTVKYENIVADLKTEIVGALEFLGLDWQDSVAAFDERAKQRVIRTPSREQVRQKIYTKARGRWLRYREFMGGAPDILRPWAEKFGYDMGPAAG